MVPATSAARLAVIAYLFVLGSCSCSNGTVQGILGKGVSLHCMPTSCGPVHWRNDSMGETSRFIRASIHTSVNSDGDSYKLHIFNTSAYDVGSYSCWCKEDNDAARHICSDSLELICQAKVLVNNASKLHNSSRADPFPKVTIYANLTDWLKVKCPEGAVPSTSCRNAPERAQFTYNFKITSEHHGCIITCQVRNKDKVICGIIFTIKVSGNETSTRSSTVSSTVSTVSSTVSTLYSTVSTVSSTVLTVPPPVNETAFTTSSSENITLAPAYTTTKVDDKKDNNINSVTDKPVSFSVIIGVCILVFIVFVVTFVVSFYISSLSSKSRSQSNQNINVANSPTDANISIGTTYAIVNKSSNWLVKRNDHPIEPEFLNSDGFYSEIDDAGKEDSSTRQPNYMKAETSVTNDHYAEVNRSDTTIKTMDNEQETDCTLYAGVNRGGN